MFNLEEEFKILIKNGWLTKDEAQKFMEDEDILSAIETSTSPQKENIFNALKKVSINSLKVVIIGQDPYPNPAHAHGYAFSSLDTTTPGSLKNIFKVIDNTYNSNLYEKANNNLENWAKQGILLLNTSLTFQKVNDKNLQQTLQNDNMKTWQPFLNLIIQKILSLKNQKIVMLLWGNKAHDIVFRNITDKSFKSFKDKEDILILPQSQIMILQTGHPSPAPYNKKGRDRFFESMPKYLHECDKFLAEDKINWINI